ncbi:LOW QUALITY PROTEIN: centromere protein T [Poecile atricapillus]|uniref:LOW QUALITY PROTEIN: centromere protein T n=1 Tax=Poecile atricapillus TaxID=48891 RepID=UPI0027383870|nr:LOW QUALITY PROTEIN: centromere protein T [Poecile atricapillus]
MASRGGGTPAASGASGPAELQLPQGPRGLSPPPPPPPRNYADHNAPRHRRNYPPHTAPRPLPARARSRLCLARGGGTREESSAVTGPAMADRRSRSRLRRSGHHNARAAAQTELSVENRRKSVRSTLAKQRLAVFPDLRNGTPRLMLKRVMQNQPQVSPLAPQISSHEETQEVHSEVPSKRVSSMGELQLPDVAPEGKSITVFHTTKKRRKLSISEFERAAERRLPQNQAPSTLDSTITARSFRMSVGSLLAPDTVEKRGLLRRPKTRKALDIQLFEGKVEQNMLNSKGQNYLVDSQSISGIRTSILTSDAEMMMNTTELFVQSQLDEQNQNKLSALEPQLSDSKTSAQRSLISDGDQEEERLEGLVSDVRTNDGRTQRDSESSSLNDEHVDRMTHISPETPAKQQEEKQDQSPQSSPMAEISFSEEEVAGTAEHGPSAGYSEHLEKKLAEKAELQITTAQDSRGETEMASSAGQELAEGSVGAHGSPGAELKITDGIGAERLDRNSHAFSSFDKPGMISLDESDEQGDELQDQAIMLDLNSSVEEPAQDEAEQPASREASMKTPAFVRAPAKNLLLSTSHVEKVAAPRSPQQLLEHKTVPKRLGPPQRKPREPQVPGSLIKEIFRHFAKMPVTKEAFKIVEKCSERYFKQLSSDLEAYTHHAGRKTVEAADLEVLMRRQGLVTDKMPLNVLIERYLPLEYRKLLIPIAVSGNKVIPFK